MSDIGTLFDQVEQLERELTPRQLRFVAELEADGNATAAAERAGYSKRSAASQASRMLKNEKVLAYRRARSRAAFEALGIGAEGIAVRLNEIYNRCMQRIPVMEWDYDQKQWVESGEWKFDARGAARALELMGDMQGIFKKGVIAEQSEPFEVNIKVSDGTQKEGG